jgi:hypothetical protein
MAMSADERPDLHRLELEVEEELRIVRADQPEDALAVTEDEWSLDDPVDVERYRVGLSDLLGAVQALEEEQQPPV